MSVPSVSSTLDIESKISNCSMCSNYLAERPVNLCAKYQAFSTPGSSVVSGVESSDASCVVSSSGA